MNSNLFGSSVQILPDQMALINSVLVILLVKVFDLLVYPCFGNNHHLIALETKIMQYIVVLLTFHSYSEKESFEETATKNRDGRYCAIFGFLYVKFCAIQIGRKSTHSYPKW